MPLKCDILVGLSVDFGGGRGKLMPLKGYRKCFFFCHGDGAKCPVLSQFLFLQDYFHELSCTAGKERIVVPIRAIGARPVLDFPAQLHFPVCIVKCSSEKTLLVQNTGNLEARYELSTER